MARQAEEERAHALFGFARARARRAPLLLQRPFTWLPPPSLSGGEGAENSHHSVLLLFLAWLMAGWTKYTQ